MWPVKPSEGCDAAFDNCAATERLRKYHTSEQGISTTAGTLYKLPDSCHISCFVAGNHACDDCKRFRFSTLVFRVFIQGLRKTRNWEVHYSCRTGAAEERVSCRGLYTAPIGVGEHVCDNCKLFLWCILIFWMLLLQNDMSSKQPLPWSCTTAAAIIKLCCGQIYTAKFDAG